ncbi:hypothetical protein Hanom_Chr17g01545111 [Helianthus anomalus]|nr:hypothetical protein HanIR_Chr13g0668471 [Helianthus annuus]
MGKILKFSLDDSPTNSWLSNLFFSPSRPTTLDSSKEVSFLLLVFFGFSSFTIKPRSAFCFSKYCNRVVILSNLGLSL